VENRLTVVAKDGLVGGAFHLLQDRTTTTFKTNDLDVFAEYVAKNPLPGQVYYTDTGATNYPAAIGNDTEPLATCEPKTSKKLLYFIERLNRWMGEDETESFLRMLRDEVGAPGAQLLGNVRSLAVEKTVKFMRQKDAKGNFSYQYTREGGSKDSFDPPSTIRFSLPVFDVSAQTPTRLNVDVDVEFSFEEAKSKDGDPTASGKFRFTCLSIQEELSTTKRKIILLALAGLKVPVLYGHLEVHHQTDQWKYQPNPLRIEGK
jgi:hypothetical protein